MEVSNNGNACVTGLVCNIYTSLFSGFYIGELLIDLYFPLFPLISARVYHRINFRLPDGPAGFRILQEL
jgi:hypothetical protein